MRGMSSATRGSADGAWTHPHKRTHAPTAPVTSGRAQTSRAKVICVKEDARACPLRGRVCDITRSPLRPSRHKSLFQCEALIHFRLYTLIQFALLDLALLCFFLNEPCLHTHMRAPTHGAHGRVHARATKAIKRLFLLEVFIHPCRKKQTDQ